MRQLRGVPLLPLIDGGVYLQDLVFVDDVGKLCWQAAQASVGSGNVYNAASNYPLSVREIVHIYGQLTGNHIRIIPISKTTFKRLSCLVNPLLRHIAPSSVDIVSPLGATYLSQDVTYAMTRAAQHLGFYPRYNFKRGLLASKVPNNGISWLNAGGF